MREVIFTAANVCVRSTRWLAVLLSLPGTLELLNICLNLLIAFWAICVGEVSARLAGDVDLNADPLGRPRFSSILIFDTFTDAANGQNPFKHLYPLCGTRQTRIENPVDSADEGAQHPEEYGHGQMLDRKGHLQSRPMKVPARALIIHDEHGRRVQ